MKVEEILKRPDGSRVKIVVDFWADCFRSNVTWAVQVSVCGPRKRTWMLVLDGNRFDYRFTDNRQAYIDSVNEKFVTPEEILAVKTKLWMGLKP
jgi:hypothetical protein